MRRVSMSGAHYTLVIGNKSFSSWSLRPWLAMKMAGLPFSEINLALRRPETRANILKHSPSGKIPLLKITVDGKSESIWDSLAICETLAERHPEAGLWPEKAHKRARARSVCAEMHAGFPDIRNDLSMDLAATHPAPPMSDALQTQIARIVEIWTQGIERHGGPFLFGKFSIADAFYAPVATRFETYGIALPETARAYQQTMLNLAPMKEWRTAALEEARG